MTAPIKIMTVIWIAVILAICIGTLFAQPASNSFLWYDPEKIVTAEPCGECHISEYEVWKATKHATGFKTLHRKKVAEDIARRMGFRLIKRESLCLKCHYTTKTKKEKLRAVSGVSCESCHGAALDWINIHNDYGNGFDHRSESTEHRSLRIARSKENGMFRPSELYEVVANCYQCHTVPHEELVNIGHHSSGSRNFDFLARFDEIRHNFLQAQFDPSQTENAERSPERKRVMYVVGKALDVEYGVRGAAVAKQNGIYLRAMQRRIKGAINHLNSILLQVNIPELRDILEVIGSVNVKANNQNTLIAAARKIAAATRRFIRNHDGSSLDVIHGLITGIEPRIVAESRATTDTTAPSSAAKAASSTARSVRLATGSTIDLLEPEKEKTHSADIPTYAIKRFIRPRSKHQTIGPSCNCHIGQTSWWPNDRHYRSAEPFISNNTGNIQIARLYGLNQEAMIKGDQICMDCHGTVISGAETQDVFDGVSCESCHGPASDYRVPHSQDRPPNGYEIGKDFGMILLENLAKRAQTCASCHYITDPRLISTGHPTGRNFDFANADELIRHWKEPQAERGALQAAYKKVKSQRGPIPTVPLSSRSTLAAAVSITGSPRTSLKHRAIQRTAATIRPAGSATPSNQSGRPIALPPFPAIDDSTSIEETLLIIKKRLELLYHSIGGKQ